MKEKEVESEEEEEYEQELEMEDDGPEFVEADEDSDTVIYFMSLIFNLTLIIAIFRKARVDKRKLQMQIVVLNLQKAQMQRFVDFFFSVMLQLITVALQDLGPKLSQKKSTPKPKGKNKKDKPGSSKRLSRPRVEIEYEYETESPSKMMSLG